MGRSSTRRKAYPVGFSVSILFCTFAALDDMSRRSLSMRATSTPCTAAAAKSTSSAEWPVRRSRGHQFTHVSYMLSAINVRNELVFGLLNSNFHYVAPQFYFSADRPNCAKVSFIEMRTYFSFGLILWDIPKFHNTSNLLPPATDSHCSYFHVPASAGGPPLLPVTLVFPVPDRGTSEVRYLCP